MKITIVTTMRNEGPHLLEWIAHHRAIGVTGFLVYTNDCEDGTEAILNALPGVEVVQQESEGKPPQWRALKEAWAHPLVVEADWVSCLDCDEFINLSKGIPSVPDLVDAVGGDAILLRWRLFGNSDQAEMSARPTTQRFCRAAPEDLIYPAIGSYFKTLFRRDGPFRQLGVHRPRQKNPERHAAPVWHDGSGDRRSGRLVEDDGMIMDWGAPIARNMVQLNHYSLRSAGEFMTKRDRGLPNHRKKQIDLTYWVERNFNAVEDSSITWMRAATAAQEAEFLNIEGVKEAVDASRRWHRTRFEALMADSAEQKLYARLLLAGSSDVLDPDTSLSLINMYQAAHAQT